MGTVESNITELKVIEGFEYSTHIMDIYDESEYYYMSFLLASKIITEMVNRTKFFITDNDFFSASKNFNETLLLSYPNNIISFCADRGQGKTSAMISMADALKKIHNTMSGGHKEYWRNETVNQSSYDEDNPVIHTHFEVLDPIDPTLMGEKDCIVRNIVSKMFKIASNRFAESGHLKNDSNYNSLKNELLQHFLKCFRCIDYIYKDSFSDESAYDDLSMMAEFGDSTSLKYLINSLVELYLRFMSYENHENNCMLVIQIDDADNNTKRAYDIAEEIRKYFVLPRVIVFLAMHMGTMSRTIEQHFVADYLLLINNGSDETIKNRCHKMMERYIDKLIPANHQIYLPNVKHVINNEYDRINISYTKRNGEMTDFLSSYLLNPNRKEFHFQEQLITLIYQKTGIILVEPNGYLHDFLPNNLRELNHFVSFLNGMENLIIGRGRGFKSRGGIHHIMSLCDRCYNSGMVLYNKMVLNNEIDKHLSNLDRLQEYLLNSWCTLHLKSDQLKVIEKIHNASRELKNLRTIELIKEYAKKTKNEEIIIPEKDTASKTKVPFSGVVLALDTLENFENPQSISNLVTAVRMYYTIYLHMIAYSGIKQWINDSDNIDNSTPFKELVETIGYRLFPEEFYNRNKKIDGFNVDLNQFNREGSIENNLYRVLLHFLYKNEDKKPSYASNVVSEKNTESKVEYMLSANKGAFDYLRPLVSMLGQNNFAAAYFSDRNRSISSYYIPGYLVELLCNVDVQLLISGELFKPVDKSIPNDREYSRISSGDKISGIYSEIDKIVNDNIIVNAHIHTADILKKDKFDYESFNKLKDADGKILILGVNESDLKDETVRITEVVKKPNEDESEKQGSSISTENNPTDIEAANNAIFDTDEEE